jgi:hypothetical protein
MYSRRRQMMRIERDRYRRQTVITPPLLVGRAWP